jgi:imidazolonepropionase-like amidohydrolase
MKLVYPVQDRYQSAPVETPTATEGDIKPWLLPPRTNYILTNAKVVDVVNGTIRTRAVKLRNGLIEAVLDSPQVKSADLIGYTVIDLGGRYLCPGLIDCHVHITAVPGFGDLRSTMGSTADLTLLRQPYVCGQMLHRGFTSVRDCGGAQLALKEAVAEGVFPGPRIFLSCKPLTQTGGHGDARLSHEPSTMPCCAGIIQPGRGQICDGEGECARATREQIRAGADFIKIMGSGGVASPTDKIDHLQFTASEIRTIVECATNAGIYVTAHAYTPTAIRHCIDNGVMGIEHGNLIDAPTAKLMAEKGAFLTPTLVTYEQMAAPQWRGYLPQDSMAKNEEVLKAGLESVKIAHDAGVTLCYGTDLLGPLGVAQSREFTIRARVLPPLAVLQTATVNAAAVLRRSDSMGRIEDGFLADLLVLDSNPLENVTILDDPESHILVVIKDGRVYKSRWEGVKEDVPTSPKI